MLQEELGRRKAAVLPLRDAYRSLKKEKEQWDHQELFRRNQQLIREVTRLKRQAREKNGTIR